MPTVTIRDVPEPVRARLAEEARVHGQSLQVYLLNLLIEHAEASNRNRELLQEAERWFAEYGGGIGDDGPDPAEIIHEERRKAGRH